MRKLLMILFICIISSLQSCFYDASVDVTDITDTVSIEKLDLVQISDIYYYDRNTKIVYIWSGLSNEDLSMSNSPVPYPATNGLPFKFNEETKQMEEIKVTIDLKTGKVSFN